MKFFTNLLSGMTDAEIVLMYEIFKRHFPEKNGVAKSYPMPQCASKAIHIKYQSVCR